MSLIFKIDWLGVDDAVAAPELRATFSTLEIWVDGECVTMSHDIDNQSVRRSIVVSMYPVAEWIAFNWWLLVRNSRASSYLHRSDVRARHSLTAAGDGYAWPDLSVLPQGDVAEVRWRRTHPAASDIVYVTEGRRTLAMADVQQALSDVVDSVIFRLVEKGITETPLQEEWARLQALTPDEVEFCDASARLGLDPFSEGIELADALQIASEHLDAAVLGDFFDAAEPDRLADELSWVQRGLAKAQVPHPLNGAAFDIGQFAAAMDQSYAPWGVEDELRPWLSGYRLAQEIRSILDLSPDSPLDDRLPVHVEQENVGYRSVTGVGQHPRPEAVVNLVLSRRMRDLDQRFAVARALWHALTDHARPFLLTSAPSSQQRAGRAFAAELLAPAEGVRSLLADYDALDPQDVVSDIADHFGTRELVVLHQIENQLT